MSIFDNYKKKYEEAQEQILSLKNKELELTAKIAQLNLEGEKSCHENEILQAECTRLKDILGSDEDKVISAKALLLSLQKKRNGLDEEINKANMDLKAIQAQIRELEKEYVTLDEAVLLQSFGLYHSQYDYSSSNEYKDHITDIKRQQEDLVLKNKAAVCTRVWSLEGSAAKGRKFETDNIKQILRSFNIECDDIIQKVKFNNFEASRKKIQRAFDLLNKLNDVNKISITQEYLKLKLDQLVLTYELAQKKQEEKEELRRQREIEREEKKLAKEIEEKRAEIEKEQQHYNNAVKNIDIQIAAEKDDVRLALLLQRKEELSSHLTDLDKAMADIDYREANHRAGYVYVISNIGSFGEDIYKIGMTRRLDPLERIDELSGASVPFRFDVHALIFSNDAPGLEAALHREFEDRKVNAVNGRKEFFNVSLQEIETVVKKYHDKTVEFNYLPDAQQYRESLLIKKERDNSCNITTAF